MFDAWLSSLNRWDVAALWLLIALVVAVALTLIDMWAQRIATRRRVRRMSADVIRQVCAWGPERKV